MSRKGLKDFKVLKRALLLRQQWFGCELPLLHVKHDLFVPCSTVVEIGGSLFRKPMKGAVKEHTFPRNTFSQISSFPLKRWWREWRVGGLVKERKEDKLGILVDGEERQRRSLRSKGRNSLEKFDRERPGFSVMLNAGGGGIFVN